MFCPPLAQTSSYATVHGSQFAHILAMHGLKALVFHTKQIITSDICNDPDRLNGWHAETFIGAKKIQLKE